MLDLFARMTPDWFNRAYVYTGSAGPRFRFRTEEVKGEDGNLTLRAAVYSDVCYEKAQDVEQRDFSWDEQGVEALRRWLQERYERTL
jgi:hypothetical protein